MQKLRRTLFRMACLYPHHNYIGFWSIRRADLMPTYRKATFNARMEVISDITIHFESDKVDRSFLTVIVCIKNPGGN